MRTNEEVGRNVALATTGSPVAQKGLEALVKLMAEGKGTGRR
jgi:hypothetical protein